MLLSNFVDYMLKFRKSPGIAPVNAYAKLTQGTDVPRHFVDYAGFLREYSQLESHPDLRFYLASSDKTMLLLSMGVRWLTFMSAFLEL